VRAAPRGDLDAASELARALLGARPIAEVQTPAIAAPVAGEGAADARAAAWLLLDDDRARSALDTPAAAVEVPAAFAAVVVDRALGGEGASAFAVDPETGLDEVSQGVFGYVVARLLLAHGGAARLRAVTTDARRVLGALGGGHRVVWPVHVRLAEHSTRVRVWFGEDVPVVVPTAARFGNVAGRIEVALCAHAARTTLMRDEIAGLGPGDVVVPERCSLVRDETGGWRGEVVLHAEGARRTRWRCEASRATLTIEAIEVDEEGPMGEATKVDGDGAAERDALSLAGDAPVEVCVEIARFTLPVAEIAALRAGEVLATGTPIGEHAVLRAGGRALARGQLVDVDGHVGVRITEIAK
jgi:type III secretion system YscQ/HrcQ family protein